MSEPYVSTETLRRIKKCQILRVLAGQMRHPDMLKTYVEERPVNSPGMLHVSEILRRIAARPTGPDDPRIAALRELLHEMVNDGFVAGIDTTTRTDLGGDDWERTISGLMEWAEITQAGLDHIG